MNYFRCYLFGPVLFIITYLSLLSSVLFADSTFNHHMWKDRVLVVHGTNSRWLEEQWTLLVAHRIELNDRDIVIYRCRSKSCQLARFDKKNILHWNARTFKIKRAKKTSIILIGKDGGVKKIWEWGSVVKELLQVIDRMPMRQEEVKLRSHGQGEKN